MAQSNEITREYLDKSSGIILLEFGAEHCGFCQSAKRHILNVLSNSTNIKHIKIEDGPGRKLGRSYKVKLWPTLILLKDGEEISRLIRPSSEEEIRELLNHINN